MFGTVARAIRQPRRNISRDRPVLSVRNLSRAPVFRDVSFDLFAGEVLGMAGLMGAGRTDVLRALFGADRCDSGEIILDGAAVGRATPAGMKRRGLGYTPENRKEVGLAQMLSSHDNLCMASLKQIARGGFINQQLEQPYVKQQIENLHIRVPDPLLPVSSLSGGNQQKIVIGNWLNTCPKVMFFDEPTRGIDVQAKQQVFEIIWSQSEQGLASIFVSSELEEILEVADRILVMYHGRVVAEVQAASTTLTELYRLCMGAAA
jgi:ABC-type sugar transport system ATPase subunit